MPGNLSRKAYDERATVRLEQLLVAAQAKMTIGSVLSRADMQRLNLALDEWQSVERHRISPGATYPNHR